MTTEARDEVARPMRVQITKSLRFEVFKRDSFRCQYCGSEAPHVVLHVDHIEPVALGGTNDITNLVTSCLACNLGKGDRPLGENTAVAKAKAQMDALQERRDQLEMMMVWRKGLRRIDADLLDNLAAFWSDCVPGSCLTDTGKAKLTKLLDKFSVDEVCSSMEAAARHYVSFNSDGKAVKESIETAFSKLGGICRVNRDSKDNPDIRDLYYIRGILRKRIPGYFNAPKALELMKVARSWGVDLGELRDIAVQIKNWSQFRNAVHMAIDAAKVDAE